MSVLRPILFGLLVILAANLVLGLSGRIDPSVSAGISVIVAVAGIAIGWYSAQPKVSGPVPVPASPDADAQDESLFFSTALLNGLTDPFLLLDSKRRVIFANSAADTLFGKSVAGEDVTLFLRQPAALAALDTIQSEGGERDTEINMPGPVTRTFLFRATRLLDPRMPAPARILARNRFTTAVSLHDITHIRHAEQMRADFVANVSRDSAGPGKQGRDRAQPVSQHHAARGRAHGPTDRGPPVPVANRAG